MEKIALSLIQMEQQLRIYHWQTKSYAKHSAFGASYTALGDLIDQFIEVAMGKKGRFQIPDNSMIELIDISETRADQFLDATSEMLIGITSGFDSKLDSDLMNIRDEMLAEINKLKYLITLQ